MTRLLVLLRLSFFLSFWIIFSTGLSAFTVHTKQGETLDFDDIIVSSPYLVGKFYGQDLSLPISNIDRIDTGGEQFWVNLRSEEKVLAKSVSFNGEVLRVALASSENEVELSRYNVASLATMRPEPKLKKTSEKSLAEVKLDLQEHEKLTAIEQQVSDRTVVGEAGQFDYSISTAYYSSKDYSYAATTAGSVSLSAGVVIDTPVRLYAFANTTYRWSKMKLRYYGEGYEIKQDTKKNGLSGATIGVRGILFSETYDLPEISISPRFTKSLTSNSLIGTTYDTGGFELSIMKTADPVVCFARVSSMWKTSEFTDTPKRLGFEIGAAVAFNEQVSLLGSVGLVNYPNPDDIDDQYGVINCGINYRINDRVYLQNNIQLELDEIQSDFQISFGITYR